MLRRLLGGEAPVPGPHLLFPFCLANWSSSLPSAACRACRDAVPRGFRASPRDWIVGGDGPAPRGFEQRQGVPGVVSRVGGGCVQGGVRGADDLMGGGEGDGRLGERGQAEVDDLRAVRSQQDVGRLEVTMEQALGVHGRQRLGEDRAERRGEDGWQRSVRVDVPREVRAVHVLRGQPWLFRLRVGSQERRDAWTPDGLEHLDLLREPLSGLGVHDRRFDHLHRGGLTAGRLTQEDLAHATLADPAEEFEVAQRERVLGVQGRDLHACPRNSVMGARLTSRDARLETP